MKSITKVKETWEERKGILQHKMAILTNNNRMFGENPKDEILEKLQIKYGKTKE